MEGGGSAKLAEQPQSWGRREGGWRVEKGQCMQHPRETVDIMASVTERAALGSRVGPGPAES